ncbi:MAG: GEVED domain-containing protein [Saprospiraceae bacterium]
MRRNSFIVSLLIFTVSVLNGQKPIALETVALFHGKNPITISLFSAAVEAKEDTRQYVGQAYSMTIDKSTLQQISSSTPNILRLKLPAPFNIDLDLYRVNLYSATAHILTSQGLSMAPSPENIFYRGMIRGNSNSLAIVSILGDKIQILYSDENGNKRIQQTQNGSYIAFEDKDIRIPNPMDCFVKDTGTETPIINPLNSPNRILTGSCVEVYVECDFKSYQDNGSSIPNTEAWVAALWNEVKTLYANESIPVSVSSVFIYTSTDPFAGLNSTSAVLNAFVAHIDTLTYNGRLAHFMSTRPLGGGIAYVDVICSTTLQCAVSTSLTTTIVPFPTYSWNVEVVTHEMGHNMGSNHTHACVWNGNNTQIDDCGNQWAANNGSTPEGSACYNPAAPIIPTGTGGTIMSYCHLISGVGINFNNGFGPLPGNVIRNKFNTATCNTGTCSPPTCTSLTSPLPNSVNVDINEDLSWTSAQGANGYYLTIGTTPGGSNILNNVNVGLVTTYDPGTLPFITSIYVKIVPFNNLGNATGCQEQSFITEANVPPVCTHLTSPVNGATNIALTAVLHWAHSVGNQTGYKLTIGTTPGGTQIANLLNVGNVNFYDPPGLLPYTTTIYVKITPYGASGDVNGCITESFTTLTPINGDYCSMAISLPCGASLAGNTTNALADPEAFTCGTDIGAPGLWYTFVGDGQNVIIATCTQYSYDTQLNAYSGTCASLTCVTGIDDYCNTGSLISFPTTNGVTYYILVQGWGGQVGSYTLTRTCYPGPFYCAAQGNNHTSEWISSFSLAGYTKTSGSTSYSDFTNETVTLSRGGSNTVTITPSFLQGSRNEYYRVWIDLNKDGDFVDAGETVFSAGPSTSAVTGSITIPLSTLTGITRMRVAMRYNNIPPSCGSYDFGEVEDYSVNIRCNLVISTADDGGSGTLRSVSMCADDNENILFTPALNNQTINVTTGPLVVDGIWKWMPTQGSNITIKAGPNVSRLLSIPITKSAEMQYLTLIGGNGSPGSAIDNAGTLIFRNSTAKPATSSSTIPIRNTGTINVIGSSNVYN